MSAILWTRPGDGGTIVAISGEVDVCTEAQLQQSLLRIIRERPANLMLDVSGVSFMDCAGLRALRATLRRAEMRGVYLRLIATSAAVRRIIELTGAQEALAIDRSTTDHSDLDLVIPCFSSLAEALAGRPLPRSSAARSQRPATPAPHAQVLRRLPCHRTLNCRRCLTTCCWPG